MAKSVMGILDLLPLTCKAIMDEGGHYPEAGLTCHARHQSCVMMDAAMAVYLQLGLTAKAVMCGIGGASDAGITADYSGIPMSINLYLACVQLLCSLNGLLCLVVGLLWYLCTIHTCKPHDQ
jgi:hypothetical protein